MGIPAVISTRQLVPAEADRAGRDNHWHDDRPGPHNLKPKATPGKPEGKAPMCLREARRVDDCLRAAKQVNDFLRAARQVLLTPPSELHIWKSRVYVTGTLVPYDITYYITLSFTVYDIIYDKSSL